MTINLNLMSTRNLLVFLTLLVVPFFCACEKEKTTTTIPQDPEMNHPDWNKLILTGQQRGITAIYGNYEDSLLVATQGNIYLTTNQGKDWRRVFSGSIGISGIMKHNDQLVALSSFSDIAGGPFLYSQDEGTTWTHQSKYLYLEEEPRLNRTQVDVSADVAYKLEFESAGTDPISKLPLPDQINRIENGRKEKVYLPRQARINCIVKDQKGRLYVGAEGTRFEHTTEGNTTIYPTSTDTAIVYMSRKQLR